MTTPLQAARHARGWSQARMAWELTRLAERKKLPIASVTSLKTQLSRWENGHVTPDYYQSMLCELLQSTPSELGFRIQELSSGETRESSPVIPVDALQVERELFGTMELARLLDGSDIGSGTLDALEEATDLLCRAYPKTPSYALKVRTKQRLKSVIDLLGSHITIDQHRQLLIIAGWMMALLGCVHYDMQEHEEAEAARNVAYQMAKEAGDSDLLAWTYEMAAWFALVENRYEDVIEAADIGLQIKSTGSVGVQLHLQKAKGYARLADFRETNRVMAEASSILAKLPSPEHPDHHFVFDHSKWTHYAATIYTWLGDDQKAKELAIEVIDQHLRPNGSTRAPMRTAEARLSLATVHARAGDLEGAVTFAKSAYEFETKPMSDLLSRGQDLSRLLRNRFGNHSLVTEFREYLINSMTR
jgi:tetratricopeptide (TPR) repeat protein